MNPGTSYVIELMGNALLQANQTIAENGQIIATQAARIEELEASPAEKNANT